MRWYIQRIEAEHMLNGGIVDPRENRQARAIGAGSKSLDKMDECVLLFLYLQEPTRSNRSYVDNLLELTGTTVSASTVSRFFNHAFPISGRFRKPNLVPIDKFKPENLLRAQEYLMVLARIDPTRLQFGDEKLLKGSEVYCRKTRRSVLDGTVPAVVTASDFRNTYAIYGMCGIDEDTAPLYWRIHTGNNDSDEFSYDIESAIVIGYLRGGHVLVPDNAIIHSGRDNKVLEEWLWKEFGVFVLWLPMRAPEWNPQELYWQFLVLELRNYPMATLRKFTTHAVARAAHSLMQKVTHSRVAGWFRHSQVFR